MRVILDYDKDSLDFVYRTLWSYLMSDNSHAQGNTSLTIYADKHITAYFKVLKSGTIKGKAWRQP